MSRPNTAAAAVDPGDGVCADAVATSPFSAQIKASMLRKRSWVRTLSAFISACSVTGEMEMPSSEGRLMVSLWIRSMESGGRTPVMQR